MSHVKGDSADAWHLNMLIALIMNVHPALVRQALIRVLKYVVEDGEPDQMGVIRTIADNVMYGKDSGIDEATDGLGMISLDEITRITEELFLFNEDDSEEIQVVVPDLTEAEIDKFIKEMGLWPDGTDPFDSKEEN